MMNKGIFIFLAGVFMLVLGALLIRLFIFPAIDLKKIESQAQLIPPAPSFILAQTKTTNEGFQLVTDSYASDNVTNVYLPESEFNEDDFVDSKAIASFYQIWFSDNGWEELVSTDPSNDVQYSWVNRRTKAHLWIHAKGYQITLTRN